MKKNLRSLAFMAILFLPFSLAFGQQIPFQGRLMENNVPVNDTLEVVFSIAELSWSETHGAVAVRNGLYSVVLGSVNPIPENIFDEVQERSLAITVKGTALSPVSLYPSLAKARPHYTKVLSTDAATDTASTIRISGGNQENFNIAAYSEAATNAGNISYYGKSLSKAGTTKTQYGVVGQAIGNAEGTHIGIYGNASSKGKKNYALYGIASGEGDGSTGIGVGSYNQGVIAQAQGNAWGNVGGFGYAFGDKGVDNIGLVGWSEVNTATDTTVNNGVVGWARGNAINKGVVGYATGGKENWAGWFEGDVKLQGKYLHARVDSISINDINGKQSLVLESMLGGSPTSYIGGKGPNGKNNFQLYSGGPERNYGNLGLYDAEGKAKAWLSAYYNSNLAGGLLSLYGPSAGWIGAGFKQWDGEAKANLPYISLEGNTEHAARVWMSVDSDETGNEFGSLTLSSADGKALHLNAYTQLGIPTQGPNSENFLMTGKHWEGKDDYPLFELRGTINSAADGTGYTLPLISLNTEEDGSSEWGRIGINAGEIGGSTTRDYVNMGISTSASGMSGEVLFKGPGSDNIAISSLHWETNGADRGRISVMGNSLRDDGNGGSYNPALVHMEVSENSTKQYGRLSVADQSGAVYMEMMAEGSGHISISDGTGHANMEGNGNISASGTVTATTVTNTSDRRYKENIENLLTPLENVMKLRGVSYYWKDKSKSEARQIGLIAQEVEAVYPEFVHTNAEGYKSVNYAGMVAVLIEAVKELEQKISSLEQDKQQLASENASLKTELETSMEAIHRRMHQLEQLIGQQSPEASVAQATTENGGE